MRCIEKKVLFISLQLEPRVGRCVCLCELTTRGNSKSTWWLLDVFSASAAMDSTVNRTRVAKRERSTLEEESRRSDEPLKRRIREIEAELLQFSDNAYAISNKACNPAVEIWDVGESLGLEDRK